MIVTPGIVHKLIASFVTALTLFARPCLGNEPTTIDTRGFSVTFGAMWHVSTDHNGTILGGIRGEEPPFMQTSSARTERAAYSPQADLPFNRASSTKPI